MKKVLSGIVVAAGVAAGVAAVSYIKNKKDEENASIKEDNIAFLSSKKNKKNEIKEEIKVSYANVEDTNDGFNVVNNKSEDVKINNIEEAIIDEEILEEEVISYPSLNNQVHISETDLMQQVLDDNLEISEVEVINEEDNFELDSEAEEYYEDIVQAVEKKSNDNVSEIDESIDVNLDNNDEELEDTEESLEPIIQEDISEDNNIISEAEIESAASELSEQSNEEDTSLTDDYLNNTPDMTQYIPRFAKNINEAQPLVYENTEDITDSIYEELESDIEKVDENEADVEESISIADAMMNETLEETQNIVDEVDEEVETSDDTICTEEDISFDELTEDELVDIQLDEISLDNIDLSLEEEEYDLDEAIDEENNNIEAFNENLEELNDVSKEVVANDEENIEDINQVTEVISNETEVVDEVEADEQQVDLEAVTDNELNEENQESEEINEVENIEETSISEEDSEEVEDANAPIKQEEDSNSVNESDTNVETTEEVVEETGVDLDHLSFNLTIDNQYSNLNSDDLVLLEQMYKEVMSELNLKGDVNSNERAVSHVFQFNTVEDLEKFRSRIINLGFVATKGKISTELIVLHISTVEAKTMERAMKTLLNIAKETTGSYKEWKSKVSM